MPISARHSILVIATGVLLIAPVGAQAAGATSSAGVLTITGGIEASDLTITASGGKVLIDDAVLDVTPGIGCPEAVVDATAVLCDLPTTLNANLGDGNDVIDASGVPMGGTLNGEGGNDRIDGGPGADSVIGGPGGTDSAYYSHHTAHLALSADGAANDGAVSPAEQDNISTTVEVLVGGSGNDTINGTGFGVFLAGGAGNDTITGDPGDFIGYWERATPVHATVGVGGGDPNSGEQDTFDANILHLIGGTGGDVLVGNAGNNNLWGGFSNVGGGVLDGDDVLRGMGGTDSLYGDAGLDTADYSDKSGAVTLTLDGVANDGITGENDDVDATVENAIGGAGADTLTGNAGPNVLTGGPGADTLVAGAGNDVIAAVDATADSIECGADLDSGAIDLIDILSTDCEPEVAVPVEPEPEPEPDPSSGEKRTTPAPDPTPEPGPGPDPGPGGTPGPVITDPIQDPAGGNGVAGGNAPVKISAPSKLEIAANGDLSLDVACTAKTGSCTGEVAIYEDGGAVKATPTKALERRVNRKRGKVLARRTYSVRAGRKKKVTLRLNRRGRQRVIKSRKGGKKKKQEIKAIIAVTVVAPDGTTTVNEKTVTLKERRVTRKGGKGRKQ